MGWKWSVASERHGIPIGWAIDGANRHDVRMLAPTLDAVGDAGLLAEIGTLRLDRGYDSGAVRDRLRSTGIDQFEIQRRGTKLPGVKKQPLRLGLRWIVEATNTWWSNYGQLRRNTDRRARHRHAALCLATVVPHRRPTHRLAQPLEPRVTPIRSGPKTAADAWDPGSARNRVARWYGPHLMSELSIGRLRRSAS
ncbi:MAG: transposase [Acidimicrobiia bacterium]